MIREYHRPKTIDEALNLIKREGTFTVALAGGAVLSPRFPTNDYEVVDLQNVLPESITIEGDFVYIGAGTHLQSIVDNPDIPLELKRSIMRDQGLNQRNVNDIGGTIITCNGRSSIVTGLLAIDAGLEWFPHNEEVSIGNFLVLRDDWTPRKLLTSVKYQKSVNVKQISVGRTPVDLPILSVAISQWPSGRTRVALGGYGDAPIVAFDGPDSRGSELAAASAYRDANDDWASGTYRSNVAARLVKRLVKDFGREK